MGVLKGKKFLFLQTQDRQWRECVEIKVRQHTHTDSPIGFQIIYRKDGHAGPMEEKMFFADGTVQTDLNGINTAAVQFRDTDQTVNGRGFDSQMVKGCGADPNAQCKLRTGLAVK